jgi:hypothetical protein
MARLIVWIGFTLKNSVNLIHTNKGCIHKKCTLAIVRTKKVFFSKPKSWIPKTSKKSPQPVQIGADTSPSSPILPQHHCHQNWPQHIKHLTFLQVLHDSSITVAWGQHYCVQTVKPELWVLCSLGEKYVTINQRTREQWHDFRHRAQTRPWQGRTPSPPVPRLPTLSQDPSQHALYVLTARKSRQRETKWWAGLKMDLKIFWPDFFFCQHHPAKTRMFPFRFISLKKYCTVHLRYNLLLIHSAGIIWNVFVLHFFWW